MRKKIIIALSLISLLPFNVYAYSNFIYAGGENIGIEISSKGILVVGFYDNSKNNNKIKIGDYIEKVNDIECNNIDEMVELIDKYQKDGNVSLTIRRDNKLFNIDYKLVKSENKYKTGLYVKDSISGIGTLTYIDPETNIYGALGHEIIESNSNEIVKIDDGYIFESSVSSIDRSFDGHPGTKNARLNKKNKYGSIDKNTNKGIYGNITEKLEKNLVEVGNIDDLKLGDAVIRTVLSDNQVKEYNIKITKIDKASETKNIYFEIIDEKLLNETGGIVQGMSGSPIMQNGKIYGAVTHVVVENVKSGYGIFITTMLKEGEKN